MTVPNDNVTEVVKIKTPIENALEKLSVTKREQYNFGLSDY
jgi:hypothetical protein